MINCMKIVSKLVASLALGFGAATVSSAAVLTFNATGTSYNGTDTLGVFGTPGRDLAGIPFSVSMSFDTALNATNTYGYTGGTAPGAGRITVGGASYTVNNLALSSRASMSSPRSFWATIWGMDSNGVSNYFSLDGTTAAAPAFGNALNFDAGFRYVPVAADFFRFGFSKGGSFPTNTYLNVLNLSFLELVVSPSPPLVPPAPEDPTDVPEPNGAWLLGLGLAVLLVRKGRQR